MSITLDWPDELALRPERVEFKLYTPTEGGRDEFSGTLQTDIMGAPMWRVAFSRRIITRAEVPAWDAFLDQLNGSINRVRLWDWRRESPLGPASGAPVLRAMASGALALTQGWTPNVAGILQRGSYIGINGQLKRLSKTASSDASGWATLEFWPPMRGTAAAGTPLVLNKPTALFVCTTPMPCVPQEGGRALGVQLDFEEVPL